jgi:hypothetical protein
MDEFLKAWSQVVWTPPVIEYKIYYDETGKILDYTTDNLPGNYIVVDKDIFSQHKFDIKIKEGKIVAAKPMVGKLRPAETGTACDPMDVTIITNQTPAVYWKNHTYDD